MIATSLSLTTHLSVPQRIVLPRRGHLSPAPRPLPLTPYSTWLRPMWGDSFTPVTTSFTTGTWALGPESQGMLM